MSAPATQRVPGPTQHVGPLVRCSRLGRTYGTGERAVVAVCDVTCSVDPQARIALQGTSSSGKSTLLHLIAGLETRSVGEIEWPGLSGSPRPGRGGVGLVFQLPSLVPSLDVVENVELPMILGGECLDEARQEARRALELLGLDELRHALPQELSGGQAQRVGIARTLAVRPALILADEPTSRLDRATADQVIDVLLGAADEIHAALVVATHDPVIAARLEEVWPMADGGLRRPTAVTGSARTDR